MNFYHIVFIGYVFPGAADTYFFYFDMYTRFVKRQLDILFSAAGIVLLLPLLTVLTVAGCFFMRGNPFFLQKRAGKNETIFTLVKFRTMTDARAGDGTLLPDKARLNRYGKFLRKSSLDELPELVNILRGEMSFVGPRPLFAEYLPWYSERERLRHSVRPGLTGLAQINGRNGIKSWEERFAYDIRYAENCSFFADLRIIAKTFLKIFDTSGILVGSDIPAGRLDDARRRVADGNKAQKI